MAEKKTKTTAKAKDEKEKAKKTAAKPTRRTTATKAATGTAKKTTAKKTVKAEAKKPTKKTESISGGTYVYGLGRRKSSIARVRVIKNGSGMIRVNGKPMEDYFTTYELRTIVAAPLKICGQETAVDVDAHSDGGGIRGQAEAVRLGLSRALTALNPTYRTTLKKMGFLTRDPRVKERKKPGLKKARRAPQWSKR